MARRHQRFVRPPKKTKQWIGASIDTVVTVPSTLATVVAVYDAAILGLRPFTILRTHLVLSFRSDQSATAEFPFGIYGETIVTDTAAALGTTAVPNPGDEPEGDWYIYQPLQAEFLLKSAVGFEANAMQTVVVDSKAMRKVGPDDSLMAIFKMVSSVGGQLLVQGRQLIQLH